MTLKEESNLIREQIKELKKRGFQYKLFWEAAGMTKTSFYNFTGGKISLKSTELDKLKKYLNTFN